MIVNAHGHIEMANGASTAEVFDCPKFYVGNSNYFIAFSSLVMHDGRVAIHSALHDPDGTSEDFLYEVADPGEVMRTAETMVEDAREYLEELGVEDDGKGRALTFLHRLQAEIHRHLH